MFRVVVYVKKFVKQIVKQMQANKKHTKGTKPTLCHEKWLMAYGLRVTARDAARGSICSVQCRFCRAFGKEVNAERACKVPITNQVLHQTMASRSHEESYAYSAALREIQQGVFCPSFTSKGVIL